MAPSVAGGGKMTGVDLSAAARLSRWAQELNAVPIKMAIIIQECFWEDGGWVFAMGFACLGQELLLQLIMGDKLVQGAMCAWHYGCAESAPVG